MSGVEADRSVRGYRVAADVLDERPSAATRQAILAAAARQTRSGPRDARATAARSWPRARWSYAAAATVLLSTLAVMMATRTEQELPTFTASTDAGRVAPPAAEPNAVAPKDQAKARVEAAPTAVSKPTEKPAAHVARQLPPSAAPASGSSAPAPSAAAEPKRNAAAEPGQAKEEIAGPNASPPAPAVAQNARSPRSMADAAIAPLAKQQTFPPQASAERRRDEVEVAAAERAAPRAPVAVGAVNEADLSASEWLDRIIKLRQAQRHDEADAELKRFRERYPHVTVPPAAQAPAGTR